MHSQVWAGLRDWPITALLAQWSPGREQQAQCEALDGRHHCRQIPPSSLGQREGAPWTALKHDRHKGKTALNLPRHVQLSHGSQSKSFRPGSSRPSVGRSSSHLCQPTPSTQPQQHEVFLCPRGQLRVHPGWWLWSRAPSTEGGGTELKRGCHLLGRTPTDNKRK